MFVKDNNNFTCFLPYICFPKNNFESIPRGIALGVRSIHNSDEKFEKHSKEYQNYLISRGYQPGKVKGNFQIYKNSLEKWQENLNYKWLIFYFIQFDYTI